VKVCAGVLCSLIFQLLLKILKFEKYFELNFFFNSISFKL